MILYREDWDKYKNSVVHWNSTNRSWVKLAKLYQRKGIENWAWPLALINKDLVNINPHSRFLGVKTKLKIALECSQNPWYFYREVLRIKPSGGITPDPYKADRGMAVLWLYHNHIDVTSIRLRQTGKSVQGMAGATWATNCGLYNAVLLWFTISDSKRIDTIRALRTMANYLPDYIFNHQKGKDSEGQGYVTNHARNNVMYIECAQKDRIAADSKGRGFSIANKFIDEVAEAANSHISIAAMTGASNNAKQQAKEKGLPYGTVYMCTAGSFDRAEARAYYKLSQSGPGWVDAFLDCKNSEDLLSTIVANGGDRYSPLIDCTFSWRQLGLTEEHFKTILADSIKTANGDMDKVKRECLSIWSMGSVGKPVTPEQAELMFTSVKDPENIERTPARVFIKWYATEQVLSKLNAAGRLIIGIDTSNASGKDACSITIKDSATLAVVGRSDANEVNLQTYGLVIWMIMERLSRSVVIIENKSSAQGIIDAIILKCLANNVDPFKRLFNRIYQDPGRYQKELRELDTTPLFRRTEQWYNRFKGLIGFMTTSKLRSELFDHTLTRAVSLAANRMHDKVLVDQLAALEERNGRIDHPKGGHDDAAISMLFTDWFAMNGVNLNRYGMDKRTPLSQTAKLGSKDDATEKAKLEEIKYLEDVAVTLESRLEDSLGTMLGKNILNKLESTNRRLAELGIEPKSTEQLLYKLRGERNTNRKFNKAR